jgi:hypothetical protein
MNFPHKQLNVWPGLNHPDCAVHPIIRLIMISDELILLTRVEL